MDESTKLNRLLLELVRYRIRECQEQSEDYLKGLDFAIKVISRAASTSSTSASLRQFVLNVTRHRGTILDARDLSGDQLTIAKRNGRVWFDEVTGQSLAWLPDNQMAQATITR